MKIIIGLLFSTLAIADPEFTGNVPQDLANFVRADLAFISGLRTSDALPIYREIFGGNDGRAAMEYLSARAKRIAFSDCGNRENQRAIDQDRARRDLPPLTEAQRVYLAVCAEAIVAQGEIKVTSHYQSWGSTLPQIYRAMILLHESRHLESRPPEHQSFQGAPFEINPFVGWEHTDCPNPFLDESGQSSPGLTRLAGGPFCDGEIFGALGSYGVSVAFLENMAAYCTNCSPEIKAEARRLAQPLYARILSAEGRNRIRREVEAAARSQDRNPSSKKR